jgi:hypothetical protein
MFLRCKVRRKDGKQHRYWSVVEDKLLAHSRLPLAWHDQRTALGFA